MTAAAPIALGLVLVGMAAIGEGHLLSFGLAMLAIGLSVIALTR